MRQKIVEIVLHFIGGLLILFSLTNDVLRGNPFGFGMAQGYLLFNGFLLVLCGWLIFKGNFKKIVIPIYLLSIAFLFIILKIKIFELDGFRTWTDTLSYVATTIAPLNQMEFWNGERPFVLPLIYKLFGVNLTNYSDFTVMRSVLKFQFIVGVLSWLLFAYSVCRLFNRIFIKIIAITIVFLLGLGLHASMWDKLLLSESFSNSFFLIIVSLLLIFTSTKKGNKLSTVVASVFLGVFSCLYLFIRDANAYIVFFGSLIGIFYWLLIVKNRNQKKILLGISLIGIILSFFAFISMNLSTRWWAPIQHVLFDKRNTVPEMTLFFKNEGFDLFENTPYLMDPLAFKKTPISLDPVIKSEKLKNAKTIYTKFLLTHPKYTFFNPFSDYNNIYNPDNLPYRYPVEETPGWVTKITNIGYPKGIWVLAVGIILCFVSLVFSKRNFRPAILVILFLILSCIPLGILFWLSDSIEIQRHSQQLFIQSRIGFWLSILFVFEWLIGRIGVHRSRNTQPN